jgi:mRNA-degrading endonuclease RelE of RelBE toxin-antitoxin system
MNDIEKIIDRMPLKHKIQVLATIDCLLDFVCRQTLRIEKLSGSGFYRVRSGKYRISFEINERNQAIIKFIRLRNEKTYRNI